MATAISGAGVINSDGMTMVYCYKCEKCGFVENNMTHISYAPDKFGSLITKWRCIKCGASNDIIIKG